MQHSKDLEPRGAGASVEALRSWLVRLRVGEPMGHGSVAVAPVYADDAPLALPYHTLAQAMALGEVTITEAALASVPTLQLRNRGALPILIIDGEELAGGKQNRVLNVTLLVPAKTHFTLPVSCVEAGRWRETRPTFEAGEAVHPTLRRLKVEQVSQSLRAGAAPRADQAAVWAEVAERHRAAGTRSATGALHDAYDQHDAELGQAEASLPYPDDGPVGVVALVGGQATCADIFDRAATLRAYWPRLVRSYSLEALGAARAAPSLDSAEALIRRPLEAQLLPRPAAGLGMDIRVEGSGVVGAALVYEGVALHTALFTARQQGGGEPPLRGPSERARSYGTRGGEGIVCGLA